MANIFKYRLIFVSSICCFFSSCKKDYHAYYSYGPVQAIGNQEKLYVFIEIDRIVTSGKSYYDAPGSYPVGHKQELLIFDKDGLSEKIAVKADNNVDGISIHPNLTTLFAYENNIYAFAGESYGYKDSIFRWNSEKSKFTLYSLDEGQALLAKLGVSGRLPDRDDKLRKASKNAGWNFHYQNTFLDKEDLKWQENQLHIFTSIKEENLEVLISMEHATNNHTEVLTYPVQRRKLDAKQFVNLSREAHGHPK